MLSKFTKLVPRFKSFTKNSRAFFASSGSGDLTAKNQAGGVQKHERLQFSKHRLTDFGDLPTGEIPCALKYDRESHLTRLNNGVRVASEHWDGDLATIGVFVKAGSRQESIEDSGVSHFLEHLHERGTKNRTGSQIQEELASLGNSFQVRTCRETTNYTITVHKNDVAKALDLLGDMLTNSVYDQNQIEAEREAIYRECIEHQRDQLEATYEASHYTSYRDHMMGQPIKGIRENIGTITQDQIVNFYRANYVGPNIAVVGTGNVNHEQLVQLSDKYFGGLSNTVTEPRNSDKPLFTPSIMFMRDDEMANINVGTFFEAPGWTHEDFYTFQIFQRILGDYTEDRYTGAHLNYPDRQYNTMHTYLGQLADLTIQKTLYTPYSDTGLFGTYFHGNEVHGPQMLFLGQLIASDWALYLNQVEVFRAKNHLYNELLQNETGYDVAKQIGNQVLYLNRRVPRSEIATRVANIEQEHLSRVARNWLFDRDISIVAWGPIHNLMSYSHYNRPIRRSTLGWYGDAHYNVH